MLYDSLEQRSGAGVRGEIQEGGGACILTAAAWQKPTQRCQAIILQLKVHLKSSSSYIMAKTV